VKDIDYKNLEETGTSHNNVFKFVQADQSFEAELHTPKTLSQVRLSIFGVLNTRALYDSWG
jgi:hypothetical protein